VRWSDQRPAPAPAGLRALKLHVLRHTYASLLLQDGESPTSVKEQMGHSSIQANDILCHRRPALSLIRP